MTPSDVKTVVANLNDFIELPDGIDRLRKAVLTLAVSGNLVPQERKEGTGQELYAVLKQEKTKSEDDISAELPFSIPMSWALVRLDRIYQVNPRNVVPDDTMVSFLPMAKIHSKWSRSPDLDEEREWRLVKKGFTHIKENDVVLAKITPCFENEKSGIARNLTNGFAAGTTELHVFRDPSGKISPEYLLCVLRSPYFMEQAVKNMTGTAGQKRVPAKFVESFLFPLPPAEEQERIVKKVNEVMKQLDKLEHQKVERDAVRARLARSAMQALGRGEKVLAFEVLPELIKTPDDVAELEQAILALAVTGRLTLQNQKDGATVTLLQETAKKTMRGKTLGLEVVEPSEVPFAVPRSWVWTQLGSIAEYIQRGKGPSYAEISEYPVLSQKCVRWGAIDWSRSRYIQTDSIESYADERFLRDGDVLINSTGTGTVGRAAVFHAKDEYKKVVVDSHVTVLRSTIVDPEYLTVWIQTNFVQSSLEGSKASGSTNQVEWSLAAIKNELIPLPPLVEQRRIVEKINKLQPLIAVLREYVGR